MPKDFYVSYAPFDANKKHPFSIKIEEDILYSIIALTEDMQERYRLLRALLTPFDDSTIERERITELKNEVATFLSDQENLSQVDPIVFLNALNGICTACEKTGQNIFGIAD